MVYCRFSLWDDTCKTPHDSGLKLGFHSEDHEKKMGNGYDWKILPVSLTGDLKMEKVAQMSPRVAFFRKLT